MSIAAFRIADVSLSSLGTPLVGPKPVENTGIGQLKPTPVEALTDLLEFCHPSSIFAAVPPCGFHGFGVKLLITFSFLSLLGSDKAIRAVGLNLMCLNTDL